MTAARPGRSNRGLVLGFILMAAVGAGLLAANTLPPARSETQALTTTVVAGDYNHPYEISDGTLHTDRGEGIGGKLTTTVTYEIAGEPGNGIRLEPDLRARVIHDSGAVMVCEAWRQYRLEPDGRTLYLGCDRTVDFDELDEWTNVELTACFVIQQFDELRTEQPCE